MSSPAAPRRRYDSPVRREQAATTRARIVRAASDLVVETASWNWRGITVAAVAARAGVHERTVFRHFPSEAELRREVAETLEREAGLGDPPPFEDLPDAATRMYAFLSTVPGVNAPRSIDPALAAVEARRRGELAAAVQEAGLPAPAARQVAAVLDVLVAVPAYRRSVLAWDLSAQEAGAAVAWVTGLVVAAVGRGDLP